MNRIFNQDKLSAALLSALTPLVLVLIANALIFATGWMDQTSAFERLSFAPPGWFVGLMWTLIYPMWGLARWRVGRKETAAGGKASLTLIWLMIWGFLYTLITGPTGPEVSAICNVLSLIFALGAFVSAWPADKIAGYLILPSIGWITFANVLGFLALG